MKMAKANRTDLDTGLAVCAILESLERGFLPDAMLDRGSNIGERYDERKHAARVVEHLVELASQGSMFRVCFGMTVVLDPGNEVVDPDADVLAIHPKFELMAAKNRILLAALNKIKDGTSGAEADVKVIVQAAGAAISQAESLKSGPSGGEVGDGPVLTLPRVAVGV